MHWKYILGDWLRINSARRNREENTKNHAFGAQFGLHPNFGYDVTHKDLYTYTYKKSPLAVDLYICPIWPQ